MTPTTTPRASRASVARIAALTALLLSAALAACNHGTRPENFIPAQQPDGALVAVRVRGESVDRVAELYAVDSTGITVAGGGRVQWIAWSRIEAMDVHRLGGRYDVLHGETVSAGKRERIRLVSRFPQGLSDELLAKVLGAHRQAELERVP